MDAGDWLARDDRMSLLRCNLREGGVWVAVCKFFAGEFNRMSLECVVVIDKLYLTFDYE